MLLDIFRKLLVSILYQIVSLPCLGKTRFVMSGKVVPARSCIKLRYDLFSISLNFYLINVQYSLHRFMNGGQQ